MAETRKSTENSNICASSSKRGDEILMSQTLFTETATKVENPEIESLIEAVWSLGTDEVEISTKERTTLHGQLLNHDFYASMHFFYEQIVV